MRSSLVRSLGFAVPTIALVTALHVQVDRSWGEWLDGLVSGAWFALVFAAVGGLLAWSARRAGTFAPRGPLAEFALGLALAAATWTLVWALWQAPPMQPLRTSAFPINSGAMVLAALASSALRFRTAAPRPA